MPSGTFVLEFANKRNIKSMARYALRKQTWSPYTREPVEFVKLNFDFHPSWMLEQVKQAGFQTQQKLSVSYLRAGFFKRVLPLKTMVSLDKTLQGTAALGLFSPSVFTQNTTPSAASSTASSTTTGTATTPPAKLITAEDLFRSPKSGGTLRRESGPNGEAMVCDADGTRWSVDGNFFDFKEPVG